MPVLQEAQAVYGYLPVEVQTIIARELDVPLEEKPAKRTKRAAAKE